MKRQNFALSLLLLHLLCSCASPPAESTSMTTEAGSLHPDTPFAQDFSIKYYQETEKKLSKVVSDRNGVIRLLSSGGLLRPKQGQFLYPGSLVPDRSYLPMINQELTGIGLYDGQFIYLNSEVIFSNAWAGGLQIRHGLKGARLLAIGEGIDCLVSDGRTLVHLKNDQTKWRSLIREDEITDIRYDPDQNVFWLLGKQTVWYYDPSQTKLHRVLQGEDYTCFALADAGSRLVIGTREGYLVLNTLIKEQLGTTHRDLPWIHLTAIEELNGKWWFGSTKGAFMLRDDGKFDYYYGERWLPGNLVIDISKGPDQTVLILTSKGLGQICHKEMTLLDKASYFEEQVRQRHIRYGFNADIGGMQKGDLTSGTLKDSDNDGLWTAMYLASQAFRYAVTRSGEALQNCRESLDAMARLYDINPVPGFPSRSFERNGYIPQLSDPQRWQAAPDPEWAWKATTSSDEAIGHVFAFGVLAELIDDDTVRQTAIRYLDTLMQHIVDNNLYLIDYDGKPTTWGKWHPDYVNGLPAMVGDRKLNSSNIIAMLQTAYYFTRKEQYREKALELLYRYGYLDNLLRPMAEIGPAPENAGEWSKMLSESWNHSDDEMYFLGYWGLYRYALNDSLSALYKAAIIDHWQVERPERDGLWNIFTAITGVKDFDLEEAIWYLQQHPLDLINWEIMNSHRKDVQFIAENFRNQTLTEVLPPDERPVQRHNRNMFILDRTGGNGNSERSAGDIWLLPYWMGRYLGVIGEASAARPDQTTGEQIRSSF